MNEKHLNLYMSIAEVTARTSNATKLKVGAVAVRDHRILSIGYNGTPPGTDNTCEHLFFKRGENGLKTITTDPNFDPEYPNRLQVSKSLDSWYEYQLVTKKEVIHAEMNAIYKMARDGQSAKGADMFITHSPCIECAKGILTVGINNVYYRNAYRSTDGIEFLTNNGVNVEQI